MSRSAARPSNSSSSAACTSFLPPSHKLLQLAASRRAGRPVHATDLRTTKFYKTKMCPFMQSKRGGGRCSEGYDCGYAHAAEELRMAPDLQRTKWCAKVVNGQKCTDPKCGYAHCAQELQPSKDRQTLKTSLCLFWARDPKFCMNGDKCRFAHGVEDLRERLALPPRCASPLISSFAECSEPPYPLFVRTRENEDEKLANACTDITNSSTRLPTAEAVLDVVSGSAPPFSCEASPYSSCHSETRTLWRPFGGSSPDVQNKEGLQPTLLDGSAFERKIFGSTSEPDSLPGALTACNKRCSQYNEDLALTAHLVTRPVSDTLASVSASANATTQTADDPRSRPNTTAGPDAGENGYTAFPLCPSRVSQCGGIGAGDGHPRYRGTDGKPCMLALNCASGAPALSDGGVVSVNVRPQVKREPDEHLVDHLPFSGASQSSWRSHPLKWGASSPRTKTSTIDNYMSDAIKAALPGDPATSRLAGGLAARDQDAADNETPKCTHRLRPPGAYTPDALFGAALFSGLPRCLDAHEQAATRLHRMSPCTREPDNKHTSSVRGVSHLDLLRHGTSAECGAGAKPGRGYHIWAQHHGIDIGGLGEHCLQASADQFTRRLHHRAAPEPSQGAYAAANSPEFWQYNRAVPFSESLQPAGRRTGYGRRKCEDVHFLPAEPAQKRQESSHSAVSVQGPCCWQHGGDGEATFEETVAGPPATVSVVSKGSRTLNADAPPFFPRALLCCSRRPQIHLQSPNIRGVPSEQRHTATCSDADCGLCRASLTLSSREEEGWHEDAGAQMWQFARRSRPADGQLQCWWQHSTTKYPEKQRSSSWAEPDTAHGSHHLDANPGVQPRSFTSAEVRENDTRRSEEEALACTCRAKLSYDSEATAEKFSELDKKFILLSLARLADLRLSEYRPAAAETNQPVSHYRAAQVSRREPQTYSGCGDELLLRRPETVHNKHRIRSSGNALRRSPSGCGDKVFITTSFSNPSGSTSYREEERNALLEHPYVILQEAIWLRTRARAEGGPGQPAQLMTDGRAGDPSRATLPSRFP